MSIFMSRNALHRSAEIPEIIIAKIVAKKNLLPNLILPKINSGIFSAMENVPTPTGMKELNITETPVIPPGAI